MDIKKAVCIISEVARVAGSLDGYIISLKLQDLEVHGEEFLKEQIQRLNSVMDSLTEELQFLS